jgi:iron(III) transport system substrate-binding protein
MTSMLSVFLRSAALRAAGAGLIALTAAACAGASQPPAPTAPPAPVQTANGVNQALVDAARKEGTIVWYTSVDTSVAEEVAKKFMAKYTDIKVEVNRTGSERVMQRVMQEAQANVKAVDVIHTSDAGNFVDLKTQKMLLKYTPAASDKYAANFKDKDGYFFAWRSSLSVPGYNPKLVNAQDLPKTWQDLLDPKWKGKMVSAHPSYSGTIVTWAAAVTDLYKTDYFDALAKQEIMLVQSAADPVTKVTSGERQLAVNGTDYSYFHRQEEG